MSKPAPIDVNALAQATQWLVRLREEPDSEAVLTEWLLWRESNANNAAAYEYIQTFWHQMDDALVDTADRDELARTAASEASHLAARRQISKVARPWRVAGIAAAAGLAALTCAVLLISHLSGTAPLPTTARNNRSSVLPDGSAVELGARTSVAVEFNSQRRSLQLSPGEAFFKVQPDANRPFSVRAGSLEVTAVGTAFDVNHQSGRTLVTVQEGVVSVRMVGLFQAADASVWRVVAGHQLIYSEGDGTTTLSSVDTSTVLAWREGRLEYTRTPLRVVLADVNRYGHHPIEFDDARVGGLTFTGTVFVDAIEDWVAALPGALPVAVSRGEGGALRIEPSR